MQLADCVPYDLVVLYKTNSYNIFAGNSLHYFPTTNWKQEIANSIVKQTTFNLVEDFRHLLCRYKGSKVSCSSIVDISSEELVFIDYVNEYLES